MNKHTQSRLSSLAPLDRIGWLSEQSPELVDWVERHGRWKTYPAGSVICRQEAPVDGMYGLGDGALDVSFAPDELEDGMILRAHTGTWIGQGSLLPDNLPRTLSVSAGTDSNVLFIAGSKLRKLLQDSPHLWPAFFALTMIHTHDLMMFLGEALSLSPRARMARLLLRLSSEQRLIEVSQHEIGVMIGVPRTTLRRVLSQLTQVGAIETGYNRIVVIDRQMLEAISKD